MPLEKLIELLTKQPCVLSFKRSPRGKYINVQSAEIAHYLKELELYKKALEYACYRLETLDMGSSHSWKARTWKKVIFEKVRELE